MSKKSVIDPNVSLSDALSKVNEIFSSGLAPGFELVWVKIEDCREQPKNARYFEAEKMEILAKNIKKDKFLESVPLLYRDSEGIYWIISGHNRKKAALKAGKVYWLALCRTDLTQEEVTSRQLSHNALVGKDDKTILLELLASIQSAEEKLATGLAGELGKIEYQSLNMRLGTYKELTLLFLEQDAEKFELLMQDLDTNSKMLSSLSNVNLVPLDYYDRVANALRKIKKIKNIKSTPTAFMWMVELAEQTLQRYGQQDQDQQG